MKRLLARFFLIIVATLLTSCEDIDNLITVLGRLEKTLKESPRDWIAAIGREADNIRGDLGADLRLVVQEAAASSGAQARCFVDFAASKISPRIKKLRDKLRKERKLSETDLLELFQPFICDNIPKRLDLTRGSSPPTLTWNGFNLNPDTGVVKKYLRAWAITDNAVPLDVTRFLTNGNVYEVTLNLSGNGHSLGWSHRAIELRWGTQYGNSVVLSEVPILQPSVRTVTILPRRIDLEPKKTAGDYEFAGHGPLVRAVIAVAADRGARPRDIRLKFTTEFRETGDNSSAGDNSFEEVVYRADDGWEISRIVGTTGDPLTLQEAFTVLMVGHNEVSFRRNSFLADCDAMVDAVIPKEITSTRGSIRNGSVTTTSPNPDYPKVINEVRKNSNWPNNGLASQWVVRGDNKGKDLERWSRISVSVEPVKVELKRIFR